MCRQRSSKEEEHSRRVKTELLRQVILGNQDLALHPGFLNPIVLGLWTNANKCFRPLPFLLEEHFYVHDDNPEAIKSASYMIL